LGGAQCVFRGRTETSEESPGVNAGQADRRVGVFEKIARPIEAETNRVFDVIPEGTSSSLEADRQVCKNLDSGAIALSAGNL
jgi:hypothetical protein